MGVSMKIGIAVLLLLLSDIQHSFANQCAFCPSSSGATGKNVKEWFTKLSQLSGEVAKSCLDLPQADKVNKLETLFMALENKCNRTEKNLQLFKAQTEKRLGSLEKQLLSLTTSVNNLINNNAEKMIENGKLEKRGTQCHIKCNQGSYAYPAKLFSCSSEQFWQQITPRCIVAKSCKDVAKLITNPSNGVYHIRSSDGISSYDVYCDMSTDNGGWTLVAVIANGDGENWVFKDTDKDFGDSNSLWENSVVLGKVRNDTTRTAKDFKSLAFNDLRGNELLIGFKGKSYIQTGKTCIGNKSLKQLFNVMQFKCAGSSYNCMSGKCLGTGATDVSSKCTHKCTVAHYYPLSGGGAEPLANNRQPESVMLKAGEADRAQDGNKDRVYISTFPYRDNVDYVPGLGSFTSLSGTIHHFDIGVRSDVAKQSSDRNLFYALFVR